MLQVSGQLSLKMGGPSFYPRMTREALEALRKSATGRNPARTNARRSVYMMTKRSRLLPLMTTFDFRDTTVCAANATSPPSLRNVGVVK